MAQRSDGSQDHGLIMDKMDNWIIDKMGSLDHRSDELLILDLMYF